jgi:hypothetical protein
VIAFKLEADTQLTFAGRPSIQEQFESFHADNPRVWELYKRFALELVGKGRKRYGISMITERIRWETAISTNGEEFKISNNFRSRYARKLMSEVPELAGMFRIKPLRTN